MTIAQRRRQQTAAIYGTRDFTARLAAREAALGLAADAQAERQAGRQADVAPDAPEPPEPPAAAPDDGVRRDTWGNVVLAGDPDDGPYIIRSQWDGRLIPVCAEFQSGKHLVWWVFDEELMRPVCSFCFNAHDGWKGW